MKKAFIFPGQGSQFPGMGKDLYEADSRARSLMELANEILGYRITDVMFHGSEEELKQTKITQPAIFLHSIARLQTAGSDTKPDMVAGHSLGEFSSLVANGCLTFEDALKLVYQRAMAMQKACGLQPSTMAAVLGLDDETVEKVCASVPDTVVAANYNCPGQIVISGTASGVAEAGEKLKQAGAKRVVMLPVGGAFHSPLMEPARLELEEALMKTRFSAPFCPVYQNASAAPALDPDTIRINLMAQLTAPVRWTQSVETMIADGATRFMEVGPGNVLQGLVKKINREVETGTL